MSSKRGISISANVRPLCEGGEFEKQNFNLAQ